MITNAQIELRLENMDASHAEIPVLIEKLQHMDAQVYAAFEQWFTTKQHPALEVEGFTVEKLLANHPERNAITAYLALDWLKRNPVQAKHVLTKPVFLNPQQFRLRSQQDH